MGQMKTARSLRFSAFAENPRDDGVGGRCWHTTSHNDLVDVREVHSVSVLQAGNVSRVVLHLKIGAKDGHVNGFTLGGVLAFDADAIQFQISIVRLNESLNHCRTHGS